MKLNRNLSILVVLTILAIVTFASIQQTEAAAIKLDKNKDDCEKCGPTRLIGCRSGRCYYKCTRRCLGKDNKFYYEAVKFNFAGQR